MMGAGPIPATEKALAQAGLSIGDIGAFEVNEAFAVQVIAFLEHFGIDDDDPRVNPYGGAIAMGHPLASSGVRLMNQLAATFAERPEVRYGRHHDVHRHRDGRHRDLGEPALHRHRGRGRLMVSPSSSTRSEAELRELLDRAVAMSPDEVVTEARPRDVALPQGAGTMVLITLDNGLDHHPPQHLRAEVAAFAQRRARRSPRARRRGSDRRHRQAVHPRRRRRPVRPSPACAAATTPS